MKAVLLLALLASLSFAATHNGDGTFVLRINQSIGSHTQYVVVLESMAARRLPGGNLSVDNATYAIYSPGGSLADRATLAVDGMFNATYPGTGRTIKTVLSVEVKGLGYDAEGPYAKTKVSSASFGTPLPLNVTSLGVTPRVYDATVYWTTNDDANGTAYVSWPDGSPVNSSGDPLILPSHELRVGGLAPDTDYAVVVEACDPQCVRSVPLPFTTLQSGSANPAGGGAGIPGAGGMNPGAPGANASGEGGTNASPQAAVQPEEGYGAQSPPSQGAAPGAGNPPSGIPTAALAVILVAIALASYAVLRHLRRPPRGRAGRGSRAARR